MRAILDDRQVNHDPKFFMSNGKLLANPEQPKRVEVLREGAEKAGAKFEAPQDFGMGPIAAIHTPQYLTFLENIYTRWQRSPDASAEVIPNLHPLRRTDSYPKSAIGQAGYHQGGTSCPIGPNTWQSAYWSAQTAITGAEIIIQGEKTAYALCRPPGHHAYADLAEGFCFLNNAAIAAQHLSHHGLRPVILDVDVHHGNGTQDIFYSSSQVYTVSLHADPERFYPFFWGHAHEYGAGRGLGYNLNIPLKRGTGDDDYLAALKKALVSIKNFGPHVIVVALGLDAYENDPLKGLAVTTEGFSRIGAAIATLGLPCLIVQEGGYLSQELGHNLASFLNGLGS